MSEKIDITKLITKEELEAVIGALSERQEYFKGIAELREKTMKKSISKISEVSKNIDDELVIENIKKISNKLLQKTDEEVMKIHGKELAHQQGINEFLLRFTSNNVDNYLELFTSTKTN